MASEMARRAANILVAQGGSQAAAMRKAGYAPKTARDPSKLRRTKEYQEIVNPVIAAMERERDAAVAELIKKRGRAGYRDLVDGVDKLTKNIQLLGGGKTSNDGVTLSWES